MGSVSKLPPPRRAGILAQVRSEGFRDGVSQAAMADQDDTADVDAAYWRGFARAEVEIRSRWQRWFALGFVIGCIAGYFSGHLL